MRFLGGIALVAIAAGCHATAPSAPAVSGVQTPQLPSTRGPAPPPIAMPRTAAAVPPGTVQLTSFSAPGEADIRIHMPPLAQAPPALGASAPVAPMPPESISPAPLPNASRAITIDEALSIALAQHPDLASARQDVAIADAQRVIANTYPFNPTFESTIQAADNFGLAQHIKQSYTVLQEIERGGKGNYRRGGANAAFARADWQRRSKELTLVGDVYRRFQAVLIARQKLELARETRRLNERLAEDARSLLQAAKATGADVLIAQQEALDARQSETVSESELQLARLELRSALGISEEVQLDPQGELRLPERSAADNPEILVQGALANQPEIMANVAALEQANAAVCLAIANQKANVTFGPAMEIDEAKTFFIGGTLQVPLQIYNKKEGEVLQAEAERGKAVAELELSRLKVRMAVLAAWQQLAEARRLAAMLSDTVLPASERNLQDAEKLLGAGQMDLLKLVELRRRQLLARQQLVDVKNQIVQRQIDLETLSGRLLLPELIPHERPQPPKYNPGTP